ncbi:hypothetical protein RQP46_008842 [Phenoliferia psychrophenolica]
MLSQLLLVATSAFTLASALSNSGPNGPPPPFLGTSERYAILGQRGISCSPTCNINGDMGVSPASAGYITGFSLQYYSGDNYAVSSQVTGKVYASDYTDPTPSNLTTAVPYVDAQGRTDPDYVNLNGGNIGGLRFSAGLYKWSTDVYINNLLRLTGTSNDSFIFQIAGQLTTSSAIQVKLIGGVRPENVFWSVAGGIALGTTSTMVGVLSSQTKVFFDTNSVLNGRVSAGSAVSMQKATINPPPMRDTN